MLEAIGEKSNKLTSLSGWVNYLSHAKFLLIFQDSRFTTFLYPSVIFVDRSLLPRTLIERDASEFGKNASIANFHGNSISVRRADGSLVTTAVSPYPAVLFEYTMSNRWTEATKLCR
jgi:intraflagellar transport protein 80